MAGTILYLHGFCSSPASWKARLLSEEMQRRGLSAQLFCPQLSPVPAIAMAAMEAWLATQKQPVTVIGSSLGGHYASYLAARHGLRPRLLDRCNSGDTAGDRERVVGYAAFALEPDHGPH